MKSFRGERLAAARFAPGGIEHDRRFKVVDQSELRRGLKISAREWPRMLGNAASVSDGAVHVKTATGVSLRSDDPAFEMQLQSQLGRPISLHEDRSGENHDDADVLVITLSSLRAISAEYGSPRNPLRFRPNIILDGDAEPFAELAWPGRRFQTGSVELEAMKPDIRCAITTIDPDTLAVDPEFLRFLVEKHDQTFGVYCRVLTPGSVREGDEWKQIA